MDLFGSTILLFNLVCVFLPGNAFWPINLAAVIVMLAH